MFEIPLRNDLPNFEFTFDLENDTFRFSFLWNERMQKWFFSILTSDGTAIIYRQPCFVNYLVLDRFKDERLPAGKIIFFDTSGKDIDPGRDDLGERVKMIYAESTEEVA